MSSKPPTRRSRRQASGDPSLPIIPILIGVIVLGFVIGAGLSLAGRHDTTVVAVASSPSAQSDTAAPVTPAPTEKPTPVPTEGPTDVPTRVPARPSAAAALASAVAASPPPKVAATPRVAVASAVPSVAAARATPTGAPEKAQVAAAPTRAVSATDAATVQPSAAPAATPTGIAADSAFATLSAAVVRQYLEAVKRGDEDGAYAALGTSPGAKGASLSEAGVVDSRTHVGRIDAHAAANDNVLVSVQLQTASGPYFGQYTVHKTDTGAAVITAHSIAKP